MDQIITGLGTRMSDELKPQFAQLFKEVFTAGCTQPIVTIDDIKHELEYEPETRVFKPSTHIGQRKLFLTELQFLTDAVDPTVEVVVVYAGAAPSNHTGYLSQLFPNVKFILVDPNPFNVFEAQPVFLLADDTKDEDRARSLIRTAAEGNERIYIINGLFTMELANAIAEIIPQHYFISDIRTNVASGEKHPDSLDILWNLAQQYNWMKVMNPISSMLKFRHPFYNDSPEEFRVKCKEQPYSIDFELAKTNGIDFITNFETRNLIYWNGTVNIQAWSGPASTESRLITTAKELRDWGTPTEYENKYFAYNTVKRCYGLYVNENADRKLGFDYCNDCSLENLLWKNYIKKYPEVVNKMRGNVKFFVARLSHITHRHLIREKHGRMFGRYNYARLNRAVEDHNRNQGIRK